MFSSTGTLLVLAVVSGAQGTVRQDNGMTYENSERRRWHPIQSCTVKDGLVYSGYECEKAFDGEIDAGRNGWSIDNGATGWVEFTLRDASKVNRVALKSLWDTNNKYRPKAFKIELLKSGIWISPTNMRLENSFFNGDVEGNQVTMHEIRDDISVAFRAEEDVTKVKIIITEVNSSIVLTEVLVQYVPEMGKCMTVGGTQIGKECIFPFVNPYTHGVHYGCTTDFGLPPWCATRVNSDLSMTGYQYSGFCNASCEVEEPSTCYAMWSKKDHKIYHNEKQTERRNCVFPFKYDGKWHTECVSINKKGKMIPICATVVDKNGVLEDQGYCGPECPGSDVADQCVTAVGDRDSKGNRCVFPYHHADKYYTKCDDGQFSGYAAEQRLCATRINRDNLEVTSGQWAYCGTEPCDEDACITVGGADVGQTCKFPFRNKWTKELHYGCTTASLEEIVGGSLAYASASWCATDTDAADDMISGKWGFCSKKCAIEEGTNCYVNDGTMMRNNRKCIFPFIYNGLLRKQCIYVKGILQCPIEVDNNGIAEESDMRPCGLSHTCFNSTTINGNPITIGWKDIGSYSNFGSKPLDVAFAFETGVEDSSEYNWNVEASVSAGFDAFGASIEASVTVGGGGGASSSTSSHQSHSLSYSVPPRTTVVLSQQVFNSGNFESRTFKLILSESSLEADRSAEPSKKELNWEEHDIVSRKLD